MELPEGRPLANSNDSNHNHNHNRTHNHNHNHNQSNDEEGSYEVITCSELDRETLEAQDEAADDVASTATTTSATAEIENEQDCRFNCNICLDPVTEPVVTRCGHMYCWPCLYRWLEPGIQDRELACLTADRAGGDGGVSNVGVRTAYNGSRRVCPVCKAQCSVSTVVPIYVRALPEPTTTRVRKRTRSIRDSNVGEERQPSPDGDDRLEGSAEAHGHRNSQESTDNRMDASGLPRSTPITSGVEAVGLRRRRISSTITPSSPLQEDIQSVPREGSSSSVAPNFPSIHNNSSPVPMRPLPPPAASQTEDSTHDLVYQAGIFMNRQMTAMHNENNNNSINGNTGIPSNGGSTQPTLHQSQSLFQALLGMQVHATHPQHNASSSGNGMSDSNNRSFIPPIHRDDGFQHEHHQQPQRQQSGGGGSYSPSARDNGMSLSGLDGGRSQQNVMSTLSMSPAVNVMGGEGGERHHHHMAFLSRLLVMLGSFVILCLLLF